MLISPPAGSAIKLEITPEREILSWKLPDLNAVWSRPLVGGFALFLFVVGGAGWLYFEYRKVGDSIHPDHWGLFEVAGLAFIVLLALALGRDLFGMAVGLFPWPAVLTVDFEKLAFRPGNVAGSRLGGRELMHRLRKGAHILRREFLPGALSLEAKGKPGLFLEFPEGQLDIGFGLSESDRAWLKLALERWSGKKESSI